jgi:hypothetical protein
MTYSVFAVDANALSPSGCSAYTYTLNGFLPYLRAPFFQFSEQAVDDVTLNGNTNPAFPFLTGHGGANQVVPFGYLGIRTDQPVLYLNPSLPPQIPYIRIRTFHYAGATLSATMNSTHTNLTRLLTPSSLLLEDKYSNTTLPFTVGTPNSAATSTSYNISINQTITLPNRLYWQTNTYSNNIIQCQPVSSSDSYLAGQFPVAAIDGASATRWQPSSNLSSSIVINTTSIPPTLVTGLYFDWGNRPPLSAVVYFGNTTSSSPSTISENENVELTGEEIIITVNGISPNLPFNAQQEQESTQSVQPVQGNGTTLIVEGGAWSGDYVRLVIEGCWEDDGMGATVGEFVVIGG